MMTEDNWVEAAELLRLGMSVERVARKFGVYSSTIKRHFPVDPPRIELAAKIIMGLQRPQQAVQALKTLKIETDQDFKHLLKQLNQISSNIAEGALDRSETFKKFSKLANDLAQMISIRSDETDLRAVAALNTVANASIEPVLKLLTLTKNLSENQAFSAVNADKELVPLISMDPMEASKEYQRLLNGG